MYTTNLFKTLISNAAVLAKRRLAIDSSGKVGYAGAGADYIGISSNDGMAGASGDEINIWLRNSPGTYECSASGAISLGALVYGDANGQITATPTGKPLGIALAAASGAGAEIECWFFAGAIIAPAVGTQASSGTSTVITTTLSTISVVIVVIRTSAGVERANSGNTVTTSNVAGASTITVANASGVNTDIISYIAYP